jgi:hypothetical protein
MIRTVKKMKTIRKNKRPYNYSMIYETSRITFLYGYPNPLLPPVLKRQSPPLPQNMWKEFIMIRRQLPWHVRIAVHQRDTLETIRAAARIQYIFRQWMEYIRK